MLDSDSRHSTPLYREHTFSKYRIKNSSKVCYHTLVIPEPGWRGPQCLYYGPRLPVRGRSSPAAVTHMLAVDVSVWVAEAVPHRLLLAGPGAGGDTRLAP